MTERIKTLLLNFTNEDTINAVNNFTLTQECNKSDIDLIAKMLGYEGEFSTINEKEKEQLVKSFKKNMSLLIQKTWIEKADADTKDEVLYKLNTLLASLPPTQWKDAYTKFLEVVKRAIYLMFGKQAKSADFTEYSLRIDPEFGLFWYYIKSLPAVTNWSDDKYYTAIVLGMYFIANY